MISIYIDRRSIWKRFGLFRIWIKCVSSKVFERSVGCAVSDGTPALHHILPPTFPLLIQSFSEARGPKNIKDLHVCWCSIRIIHKCFISCIFGLSQSLEPLPAPKKIDVSLSLLCHGQNDISHHAETNPWTIYCWEYPAVSNYLSW